MAATAPVSIDFPDSLFAPDKEPTLPMAGSEFGTLFKLSTYGESHGPAVGCVIDGCPPAIPIEAEFIQVELDRRRPGQSRITTQRKEGDEVEILSGVYEGLSTGTPIGLVVRNADARSKDYDDLKDLYRPSHADYTYAAKYGVRDPRGGGRASYREAIGRVAGGAIARKLLDVRVGIEIVGYVLRIDDLLGVVDRETVDRDLVESNIVWCPDGVVARIVPVGLGEPVFDKLTTDFANVLMSIPASRGFEVGEGFGSVGMRGSTHNDPFIMKGRRVGSRTNHSGGISNGEPIVLRVAFKPTATISREQETVTRRESRPHFAPAAGTIRACSPTRWRPWRPWSRSCWPIICSERLRFGGVAPSVC